MSLYVSRVIHTLIYYIYRGGIIYNLESTVYSLNYVTDTVAKNEEQNRYSDETRLNENAQRWRSKNYVSRSIYRLFLLQRVGRM